MRKLITISLLATATVPIAYFGLSGQLFRYRPTI